VLHQKNIKVLRILNASNPKGGLEAFGDIAGKIQRIDDFDIVIW